MIRILIKSNWDAKYIPNFRVVCLMGSRQLEVSDPTGRIRKVNVCDVHKILPSDKIVSSIPHEHIFGRRGTCINDPHILKEVAIIHAFLHENFPHILKEVAIIGVLLHENFPHVRIKHK